MKKKLCPREFRSLTYADKAMIQYLSHQGQTIDSLIHFFAMNGKCIKDELGIKRNIYSVILQAAKILAIILAGIMCKRWFQGGYQSGAAIIYLLGCVGLYLLAKASEIFLPAMIDVHIEK